MSLRSVRLVLIATAALLLTPSAASAAWTVTPTPNVRWPPDAPCPESTARRRIRASPSVRWISEQVNPLDAAPVIERWDGTSWQIMPTPEYVRVAARHLVPAAERLLRRRLGPGAANRALERDELVDSAEPAGRERQLEDVSCSGLLACTAVGREQWDGSRTLVTLAERWDGTGWHVQSTPNPAGSDISQLYGVSCPLKRTCTAVGQSIAAGGHVSLRPSSSAGSGVSTPGGCRPRRSPRAPRAFRSVTCPVRTAPGVRGRRILHPVPGPVLGDGRTPHRAGELVDLPPDDPPRERPLSGRLPGTPVLPGHRQLAE